VRSFAAASAFLGLSLVMSLVTRGVGPDPPRPVTLNVMTFNIEYGGDVVDFDKVVEAIRVSGAEVVGVEEAEGRIPRLAERLGWPYYDTRSQIVSRFPLIDPPGAEGLYLFVEVAPGRVVAIANVHLPSDPYGPDLLRGGKSRDDVLELERRRRVPPLEPFLRAVSRLAGSGTPVFLTGDFNSPTHRDTALHWPVSRAVEDAGLRDSYADAHPDALADPGLTWWAARPRVSGYNPAPDDPQDRIDFVYAGGPARVLASQIVGEADRAGVDIAVTPWPSDHRAVVSTFTVEAADMPALIAVERRLVSVGDDLTVRVHTRGSRGERVVLGRARDGALGAVPSRSIDDPRSDDRRIAFSTGGLEPGAYRAALVEPSGATVAQIPFWLQKPGAAPEVETDRPSYATGEPIVARWRNAPGNRWDWIGVYAEGSDPVRDAEALVWRHTQTAIEGEAVLDGSAEGDGWPLGPGRYTLHLLRDDGYLSLASASFSVAAVAALPRVIPSPGLRIGRWNGHCETPGMAHPFRGPLDGPGLGGRLPRGDAAGLQLLPLPAGGPGRGGRPDLDHVREGLARPGSLSSGSRGHGDLAARDRPQRRA
jgi:endonuclease/exonuclease/phosphatase family metal-dependent hydrolase